MNFDLTLLIIMCSENDARILSPPTAPSSPPLNFHVEATSSTSLQLNWDPPSYEHRNGIIRWYSISILAEQPWVNYTEVWMANGTELNITELTPFITYQLRVCAHTILPGPFSSSYSVTTLESGELVFLGENRENGVIVVSLF